MLRALLLACVATSALWAQNVVTEDAIHQAVERHVRAALQRQNNAQDRCEIHTRWKGDVVLDEAGPVEIAVRPLSSRPLRGAGMVRVELKVKGQTCRTLTVTVDTRIHRRVLVTTRALRRGELLGPEVLELEERDITLLRDGAFTDPAQVAGMQARRPMNAGEVLTSQHSQGVPLVRQGEAVELVVVGGGMELSTRGVALQDGGAGSQIRVRNQESGKILRGEVLAAGLVKMDIGGTRDE
ncbi:MAG: flagellar basal body P-ring formation protein FlgA [Candidatus Latescibacteria bacterium]|nr:flagellar basal body P-ring formation protein FlgA [Candidatus Latescibacterota bacterium]